MVYINTRRAHNQDTDVRREHLQKASYYDGQRGAFLDWAQQHGKNQVEIQKGLKDLEALVAHHRHMADQSVIDPDHA